MSYARIFQMIARTRSANFTRFASPTAVPRVDASVRCPVRAT